MRAQLLTRLGDVGLSAEAIAANDFLLNGLREAKYREARISLDAPSSNWGARSFRCMATCVNRDRGDNGRQLEAAMRLSSHINRFNLSGEVRYRKQWASGAGAPNDELETTLLASVGLATFACAVQGHGTYCRKRIPKRRSVGLLVAFRKSPILSGGRLRGFVRLGTRPTESYSPVRHDGTGADRRSGHRWVGRGGLQPELLPSTRHRAAYGCRANPSPAPARSAPPVYRDLNDNGRRDFRRAPSKKAHK